MEEKSRIGSLLVKEGVINETQLDEVLAFQQEHPDQTVGEIVSVHFDIPEQYIETVFAEEILIESLKSWFLEEVSKKLKGMDVGKFIDEVQVSINSFTRISSFQKGFTRNDKGVFAPSSEKKFLSKIQCIADSILIKTKFGENIQFDEFVMEYDVQSHKITPQNEALIVETKIKLMQLKKKNR